MYKLAQQDSPLLTTTINSDEGVQKIWNKYFADKHAKIVSILRADLKNDPSLQAALTTAFPGFSWPEFADMPSNSTFLDIKDALDKIMAVPQAKAAPGMGPAVQLYIDQYNAMIKQLQQQPSKPALKHRPAQPSAKIKQLQQLLGIEQSGIWNQQTNTTFLNWLKANGWEHYISGNRFTGSIDDAITSLLTEKASPAETTVQQRQSSRLERLKKLGI